MAKAKWPREEMAFLAQDSTSWWTADVTSSSVGRMCTFSAGAACSAADLLEVLEAVVGYNAFCCRTRKAWLPISDQVLIM